MNCGREAFGHAEPQRNPVELLDMEHVTRPVDSRWQGVAVEEYYYLLLPTYRSRK